MILSLWISCLCLGVFGSYIYSIWNPSSIISKSCHRCHPRPNWKQSKNWHGHKLHHWLVRNCRRQNKNRPPRLDGNFFPSPYCVKHRRWRRDRARGKSFLKRRRMDELLSGRKYGYCLGNLKAYQRLLGIVFVMTRIEISCNFTDYCPNLQSLTMLQMLLT